MTDANDLARQNVVIGVIELMFQQKSKKDACKAMGIAETTFDRALVTYPELMIEMSNFIRTRMGAILDQMVDERTKNAKAISGFMEELRTQLSGTDIDDAMKALDSLIKADKHIKTIIKDVVPAEMNIPEIPLEPGVEMPGSKANAQDILLRLRGPHLRNVTLTTTIKGEEDIIEGITNDAPDTLPNST